MTYFVYILQSQVNESFYKGLTDDLNRRFKEHNNGKEKSTRRYKPWNLVWYTKKESRSTAVILETKLKNLSREKTITFIQKYPIEKHVGGPDVSPLRQSGC